ncbi:DNA polymerase III subunit beta [Candidatus Uhrbacteria bacterium RIFCSPLOWO2_12_FULL_47_9]|nr:MAG: DNA polymerase III subunit beta [Candidatus Uhrbacteria bacterium RIFCSPLOWO2_12_FULL_47_9]
MKISCTQENLHQGLSITSHLVTKNVNLPILQNVLVKADGGIVKFTATNLEIAINCSVRGKIDEQGEFTIPSKLFFDYVSLLPNEVIHLETNGDQVLVECGGHKTKIHGMNASDFPLVPKVEGDTSFQIPIDDLKAALSQVLFSVATNESRPELTGVLMHFYPFQQEMRLTLASTDSYRLSEKTIPVTSGPMQDFLVVIPAKTLSEVNRVLSVFRDEVDLPSYITMQVKQNQVVFMYGPVELVSRTIEENYPDYEQIIPKQFQTQALVDREDFIKAVKTAALFSKNGLFDVTLSFYPTEKRVSVQALDATRGENTTTCDADITGVQNTVTVNFRYLLDGLQSMSGDQVMFQLIDASNPCLLTTKDKPKEHRYIVMPIKQ